jgi:hypothetical protein
MEDVASFREGKLELADGTVLNGAFGKGKIAVATSVGELEVDAREIVGITRVGVVEIVK